MKNFIVLAILIIATSCADEVIHDEKSGRSMASIEIEKAHKNSKGKDPFEVQCDKANGVAKSGSCFCTKTKEYFNPFNSLCE